MLELNPKTASIIKTEKKFGEATNKLSVNDRALTVSSTIVKDLGKPEYIRIQLDIKNKLIFLVTCDKHDEGARKFYNKNRKSSSASVTITHPKICNIIAKLSNFDNKNSRAYFTPEKVKECEHAIGFDLSKVELVKIPD